MLAGMKRMTVRMSDQLDARLRYEAERRGKTVSELTREALEAYFRVGRRRALRAAATGVSGRDGVSVRIEELLATKAAR
jgi:predicted transcriptional regulator